MIVENARGADVTPSLHDCDELEELIRWRLTRGSTLRQPLSSRRRAVNSDCVRLHPFLPGQTGTKRAPHHRLASNLSLQYDKKRPPIGISGTALPYRGLSLAPRCAPTAPGTERYLPGWVRRIPELGSDSASHLFRTCLYIDELEGRLFGHHSVGCLKKERERDLLLGVP
jgi:hypothetical protein